MLMSAVNQNLSGSSQSQALHSPELFSNWALVDLPLHEGARLTGQPKALIERKVA